MKTNRVTPTLAVAFGVLIGILVTVGYWGVERLAEMNGKVQGIVSQRWQKVQLSREALRYSALNSRVTMQIFLLQDKKQIEPLLEQRAKNSEKISELLKTIATGLESAAEKKLVANIWTNRIPYINSYKLALDLLLKEGKPDAGRKLMSGEVLTNLVAYHKAWEDFVEYQGGQMDKAGKAAQARYISARQELITMVVVATLLAAAIALFVIRNLSREIDSRLLAEKSLQQAHDDLELRVRQRTVELTGAHLELQLREERFRKLSESAPIGIFETDAAGRGLFYNPRWYEITGLSPADASGDGWHKAVHPGDAEKVFSTWQACAREGRAYDDEFRFCQPSGGERWVHTRSVVLRSATGEITGIVGTTEDITERKRAETTLRRTEELYRRAISSAGAVPYCSDFKTRSYVFIGEGIQQLIGYAPHELSGSFWKQIIQKSVMLGETAGLDKGDAAAAVVRGEIRKWHCDMLVTTRDGKSRWIADISVLNVDEAGQSIGSMGILQDITERKEAEAELARTHKELLEISRRAGMAEVATGVLHNVGNVLNSVNVSCNCVAEGIRRSKAVNLAKIVGLLREHEGDLGGFFTNDPKGRQLPLYLEQLTAHIAQEQAAAQEELADLQKHIDHIKDIVSMQQSLAKATGMTETVQVADLLEDALRMNDTTLQQHEIQVVKEFADVPPVTTQKHKVMQILVNLVRNAQHACEDSGRDDKQMTLRIMNGKGRVQISVSDNGVGIPPENLTRIFSHGFTTKKNGHGFGLHSGANAAAEMGGTLRVHSDGVGKGATFTVELPIQPPAYAGP